MRGSASWPITSEICGSPVLVRAHCYGRSLFLILIELANNANFIPWHDLSLIVRRMTDTVNSSLYRLSRTNRLAFRRFVRINISAPTSSRQHQTKNLARLSDLKKKLHAERKLRRHARWAYSPLRHAALLSQLSKTLQALNATAPGNLHSTDRR